MIKMPPCEIQFLSILYANIIVVVSGQRLGQGKRNKMDKKERVRNFIPNPCSDFFGLDQELLWGHTKCKINNWFSPPLAHIYSRSALLPMRQGELHSRWPRVYARRRVRCELRLRSSTRRLPCDAGGSSCPCATMASTLHAAAASESSGRAQRVRRPARQGEWWVSKRVRRRCKSRRLRWTEKFRYLTSNPQASLRSPFKI